LCDGAFIRKVLVADEDGKYHIAEMYEGLIEYKTVKNY
jgi:hypothetical protein